MISLNQLKIQNKKYEKYNSINYYNKTSFDNYPRYRSQNINNYNICFKDNTSKKMIETLNEDSLSKCSKQVLYIIELLIEESNMKSHLINNDKFIKIIQDLDNMSYVFSSHPFYKVIDELLYNWKIIFSIEREYKNRTNILNENQYEIFKKLTKAYILDFNNIGSSLEEFGTVYGEAKNKIFERFYLNKRADKILKIIIELYEPLIESLIIHFSEDIRKILSIDYRWSNDFRNKRLNYKNENEWKYYYLNIDLFNKETILISDENIRKINTENEIKIYSFKECILTKKNIFTIELPNYKKDIIPIFKISQFEYLYLKNIKDFEDYENGKTIFKFNNDIFGILIFLSSNSESEKKLENISKIKNYLFNIHETKDIMQSNMQIGTNILDFNLL